MTHKLTKSVFEKLKNELKERTANERKKIADQIREAREFGDLSENAAYKEAQEAELFNESRVEYLQNVLKGALVIDTQSGPKNKVVLGARVELARDGTAASYHIVDTQEADPTRGMLSIASPLGRAISGRKVGDTVTVSAPRGKMTYTIVKIS